MKGGWNLLSQFREPPARQGALDGRQQVVVDVKLLHLLQAFQALEGFHAVIVQVQDLHRYKHLCLISHHRYAYRNRVEISGTRTVIIAQDI